MIALIGAPNSGKTTLYNWLTNSKFKTVNYPGATVEYSIGNLGDQYLNKTSNKFRIIDTPGTYSLFPKSADEEVTCKLLFQNTQFNIEKVIVVIDGTQLSRHLLLAKQIKESGFAMIVAVTMCDLIKKNNLLPDWKILEKELNCPVIQIEGLLGGGVQNLVKAISEMQGNKGHELPIWNDSILANEMKHAEEINKNVFHGTVDKLKTVYSKTAQLDSFLLHPILGVVFFCLIMFALFSSIFWLATPFMDIVDQSFTWLNQTVSQISWLPPLLVKFFSQWCGF